MYDARMNSFCFVLTSIGLQLHFIWYSHAKLGAKNCFSKTATTAIMYVIIKCRWKKLDFFNHMYYRKVLLQA